MKSSTSISPLISRLACPAYRPGRRQAGVLYLKSAGGVLLGILFACLQAGAQELPDHTAMMNKTWERIDLLRYMPDPVSGEYRPYFPPKLKALDKEEVVLPGYIVPLQPGMNHDKFLLSVLPVMQCMFCGQDGIPPLVEVNMHKAVRYTDKPVEISGVLNLNTDDIMRSEFIITDGEIVK